MIKPENLDLITRGKPNIERMKKIMYDPEEFIRFLDEEGVEKCCTINYVCPDVMGFTDETNRYAGEYARKFPDRIIPFGSVHPRFTKDAAGDFDRVIDAGIKGIKFMPCHQLFYPNEYRNGLKPLESLYRKISESKIPLMIHTGTSVFPMARNLYGNPMLVEDVALDFPDIKIIMAHGGRPLWMNEAVFLVRRFKNVFMDISSIPPKKLLEYFPKLEQVADKVMFGSDWPAPGVPGPRACADEVGRLPISSESRKKILWKNSQSFFGMV